MTNFEYLTDRHLIQTFIYDLCLSTPNTFYEKYGIEEVDFNIKSMQFYASVKKWLEEERDEEKYHRISHYRNLIDRINEYNEKYPNFKLEISEDMKNDK